MRVETSPELGVELLELALTAARRAGDLIRSRRAEGVEVAATKSSVIDVVTEADRASEELIRSIIIAQRPDDAIVGEEGGAASGSSGVEWIVDPIDGTVNYLYGIEEYAVSIAARVHGVGEVGVVLDVAKGVEFHARRGNGAWRDGVRLSARPAPPMAERLILTGFGYTAEVRASQAACVARMLPQVRDIRRFGSCALDLAHLAQGLGDGYVEEGPNVWDWAAGAVICAEAGVHLVTRPGVGGRDVVLAAPEAGFAAFEELLDGCGFFPEVPGSA